MHKTLTNNDSWLDILDQTSIHIAYKLCNRINYCINAYFEIAYYSSGINQMWIQKKSKELFDNLKSISFSHIIGIKISTLSLPFCTKSEKKNRRIFIIGLNNIYSNIEHKFNYYSVIKSGFLLQDKTYLKLSPVIGDNILFQK